MESIETKMDPQGNAVEEYDCCSSSSSNIRPTNTSSLHNNIDSYNSNVANDIYEENCTNLSLLYPSRYGWTACGGITDLSTPHEVRVLLDVLYIIKIHF
jgi:hypothetical protein